MRQMACMGRSFPPTHFLLRASHGKVQYIVKIHFLSTCGASPDKFWYNIEYHLTEEPTHRGNSHAYRVAEDFNSNPSIFPFK